MIIGIAILLTVAAIAFTLLIRESDLPEPEPVSPARHLEERKAAIYENLRDLNFEYRVGKLSDDDYQKTKQELQRELAVVMAGIDRIGGAPASPRAGVGNAVETAQADPPAPPTALVCPHCKASFDRPMKFCGECGRPIEEVRA
jgi:hypothetical protein